MGNILGSLPQSVYEGQECRNLGLNSKTWKMLLADTLGQMLSLPLFPSQSASRLFAVSSLANSVRFLISL